MRLLCSLLSLFTVTAPAAEITLGTHHVIHHAADAPQTAKQAALELQHVIQQATGMTLQITSDPALAPALRIVSDKTLPHDAFEIRQEGADIIIAGNDDLAPARPDAWFVPSHGTFFGALEFLERFTGARWLLAARNSLLVGTLTTLVATPLGTLAAIGIAIGAPRARLLLASLCLPVVVPSVIAALAMYLAFIRVGLANSLAGLVLAHSVLGLPYVVLTVIAGTKQFDLAILRAAASLGASRLVILRRILLPLLAPAIGAGALFAFAISFDELIIALFIAGPEQFTLPRQMLASTREFLSPTLAAAAVLVSLVSLALLGGFALLQRRRQIGLLPTAASGPPRRTDPR